MHIGVGNWKLLDCNEIEGNQANGELDENNTDWMDEKSTHLYQNFLASSGKIISSIQQL